MKRPIQHIIEEESRSAFAQIIPHEWVKNDFLKDYGKDIHIEIFSKFQSTGNTFYVQLKANQKRIHKNSNSVVLKIKDLRYFATLDTPVLLVLYSSQSKQFWAIWANRLLEELECKETQKSVTLVLQTANLIDKNYFIQLENSFDRNIPYKINLAIESKGELAQLLASRLKGWCKVYFPGSYETDDATLLYKVGVSIAESESGLDISIRSKRELLQLDTIPRLESMFLYTKLLLENELDKSELELIYAMTGYFCQYQPHATLKLLTIILPQYNGKLKNEKSLHSIAAFALSNNLKHELQTLIENAIKANQILDFQILNSVLIQERDMLPNYLANLLNAYNVFPQQRLKATLAYNIGNYYRSRKQNHLSVKYYMLAKKNDSSYLSKHYWWSDLAGVLYISSHEKFAERFYNKAIALDSKKEKLPLTLALLGDCLFHQAKFGMAYKLYDEYCKQVILEKGKLPVGEYSFKGLACLYLIEKGYDNAKINKKESIKECAVGMENNVKKNYENSIILYPLNYHSWYAIGFIYRNENDFKNSYNAFLIAAVLLLNNRASWMECLVSSLLIEDQLFSVPIFYLMIELLGNVTLNEVVLTIYKIEEIPTNEKEEIVEEFTKLFTTYKKSIEADIDKPPYTEYRWFE